jgi:DNA-binding transcriptional LysR family regulator
VVGPQLSGSAALVQRKVGEDRFVSAVRSDHPGVGARLDLDTFVRLRHLVIDPTSSPSASMLDAALAKLGRTRVVTMRIPHFLGAPYIVARSDLLITSSMALLKHAATLLPLRLFGPPIALPIVRTVMTWHARMNEDPAHTWLRDVTQRCTTAVLTASPRTPAAGEPLNGRGGARGRPRR